MIAFISMSYNAAFMMMASTPLEFGGLNMAVSNQARALLTVSRGNSVFSSPSRLVSESSSALGSSQFSPHDMGGTALFDSHPFVTLSSSRSLPSPVPPADGREGWAM